MWPLDSLRSLFRADAPKASPASLLAEQARPAFGNMLSPHREGVAEHLKPEQLATILRNAINGDGESYLILAEEMELRETHYRSVLSMRKLAVCGIRPNVEAASDDADDRAIADHVEELVRRPEFEGLVGDLMDGVAKGFANVEILWDRSGKQWEPAAYKWRDPRHFIWDVDTLETCALRTAGGGANGEPLAPFKWLQHRPRLMSGIPLRTGIAMPASGAYMAKRYTVADWLTFLDVFGMPFRVGKFPAHMAKRKNELLRALQQLGIDAAAVIPDEMEIEVLDGKSASSGPIFRESAEYWDKQTSKVVVGQTMSSDDGSSLAQSKTHERVRFDIRNADARAISATINRDLIVPFVQLNYGPRDKYPTIVIEQREPDDIVQLMTATKTFVDMGGRIEESQARDRLGYAEPADGADLLRPAAALAAESAAQASPQDAPGGGSAPAAPGEKPAKGDSSPADKKELNRLVNRVVEQLEQLAFTARGDVIDQAASAATSDWEPLLETNVGRLIARVQEVESFEDFKSVLEELATDEGVELDISSFKAALQRASFKVRGVGSATDKRDL